MSDYHETPARRPEIPPQGISRQIGSMMSNDHILNDLSDLEEESQLIVDLPKPKEETSTDVEIPNKSFMFSLGQGVREHTSVPLYKLLGEAFNTFISVECDGVVKGADKTVSDRHVAGVADIDSVGVVPPLAHDFDVFNADSVAIEEGDAPGGRIDQNDILD